MPCMPIGGGRRATLPTWRAQASNDEEACGALRLSLAPMPAPARLAALCPAGEVVKCAPAGTRFRRQGREPGAGLARLLLRQFYTSVFALGKALAPGRYVFALADELQDYVSTDSTDALNDSAFQANSRKNKCIFGPHPVCHRSLLARRRRLDDVPTMATHFVPAHALDAPGDLGWRGSRAGLAGARAGPRSAHGTKTRCDKARSKSHS